MEPHICTFYSFEFSLCTSHPKTGCGGMPETSLIFSSVAVALFSLDDLEIPQAFQGYPNTFSGEQALRGPSEVDL